MSRIATVVVTYNRKDLLKTCINNVLNQTKGNPDVLVIDNASTDGTADTIKDLFGDNSRVIYMNTGANLGGAGGFSYGINAAVNMGYDYLWIMDDDTFPDATALEELLKASDLLENKYGFLSSYVKWTDGSSCEMNLPKVSSKWRYFVDMQFRHNLLALDSASFVSLFIKADAVKEVGLPIKEFFIWGDDVEYTMRLSSRRDSFFVYDSQVVHAIKQNITTTIIDEEDEQRLKRYSLLYRNKYFIARRTSQRAKMSFWMEVKNVVKDILKKSKENKWKKCSVVLKSALSGLFFRPKIEYVHPIDNCENIKNG